MKYSCSICGQKHEIYFGIKAGISPSILQLIEDDPKRVIESNGMYMIDKTKVVIPAQLFIKTEFKEDFIYQTWVACDAKEFVEFSKKFQIKKEGKIKGELFDNLVPYFPTTKNLKCTIRYRKNMKSSDYPAVIVDEKSEIQTMQEKEISKEEVEEIMNRLYHPVKQK